MKHIGMPEGWPRIWAPLWTPALRHPADALTADTVCSARLSGRACGDQDGVMYHHRRHPVSDTTGNRTLAGTSILDRHQTFVYKPMLQIKGTTGP
jgi:hypothetical protein